MTTEMRLPRYMAPSDQALAAGVGCVPQVASVARAGCWPVSLRHALRSFRLDHSLSTDGIMRGLNRMLTVRKHSYVQKHFDSRMNLRALSASLPNQILRKSKPASRTLPSLRSIRSSHGYTSPLANNAPPRFPP